SGGKEDEVIAWLEKFVIMEDAQFIKKSDEISQFLVFGPKAMEFLENHISPIGPISLIGLMQYHFLEITIAGNKALLQKTNRIIESGWTIFAGKAESSIIWTYLQAEIESLGGTVIDDN